MVLALLFAVLVLAPLVFLRGHVDFSRLPQQAFVQLSALSLLLVWALGGRPLSIGRPARRAFDLPLLAFLALSALSLVRAMDPGAGLVLLLHWLCCAAVYLLVSRMRWDERSARRLATAILTGGAGVALVGLAQAVGGLQLVPQAAAPAATMANRNVAAGYLVALLPLALAAWPGAGRRSRVATLAMTAAIVAYLPFSLSRLATVAVAGQVVLLAALVVWPARGLGGLRRPSRLALAGVASLVALALTAGTAWLTTHDAAKARSLGLRVALARTAADMFAERPLTGVGLGNFGVHYPRLGPAVRVSAGTPALVVDSPHSEPLQVLAETGVGGGLTLVWLAVSVLLVLTRLGRSRSRGVRRLALAVGLALLGFAVDAAGGFPLRTAVAPLVVATLLGVLAALAKDEEEPVLEGPRAGSGAAGCRWALAAGIAVVLATSVGWSARRLSADRSLYLMREALTAGWLPHAVALGRDAVRSDPWRPALGIALAHARLRHGEPAAAGALLESVLSRRPWDVTALGSLGLARLAAGEAVTAVAVLQRAVELDPGDDRAKRALDQAATPAESGQACAPGLEIEARGDGRVDLVAEAVPLAEALRCLSDRAGFRLEFDGSAPAEPVSVVLRDQPLTVLFESLFEGLAVDYLLGFDPSGARVVRLIVVDSSGSSVQPSRPSPAAAPPAASPRGPGGVGAPSRPGAVPPPMAPLSPPMSPPAGAEWGGESVDPDFPAEDVPDFPEPGQLSPMTLQQGPGTPYAVRSRTPDRKGV